MSQRFCAAALVPKGFTLEQCELTDTGMELVVRPIGRSSICPQCGGRTSRVHSRYRRRLGDLPLSGRPVRLILVARRYRCNVVSCKRHIFAERFGDGAVAPWARRTARLDLLVFHLGLALGGRPGARFARRLIEARTVIPDFHAMIRKKAGSSLESWLERAQSSAVGSFANGIRKDLAAVRAAIVSPWSNGQTDGQITKLKLVKRQMYGRAKLDLLEARLIGAIG